MIETTVCTFDINNLFDNSAKIFDLDEAPIRKKKKHIKVLFRGVSKDNSHKVIVVFKIAEGVICKHNLEKFDNINKWYRYEYCCSKYSA